VLPLIRGFRRREYTEGKLLPVVNFHPQKNQVSISAPLVGRGRDGFSLIEILVALGIVALLVTAAIPAFSNIGRAGGVTDAAYQISAAIELARAEAVARRTFVWLGLQPTDESGNPGLAVGLVFSRDGTPNPAGDNLQAVRRLGKIERVALANETDPDDGLNLAGFDSGASFQLGNVLFEGCTLTFTPAGEITTMPAPDRIDGFVPRLIIPLRGVLGSRLDTDNAADVLVDGSIGISQIRRNP